MGSRRLIFYLHMTTVKPRYTPPPPPCRYNRQTRYTANFQLGQAWQKYTKSLL